MIDFPKQLNLHPSQSNKKSSYKKYVFYQFNETTTFTIQLLPYSIVHFLYD